MAKPWYKSFIPDSSTLQQHPSLQRFGPALQRPSLWHLSRRSARAAVAVGLFCAMLPIPVQMLLAAFFAIWLRGHLPLTIALVWLNNPVTIAPIFYAGYKFGSWMLGTTAKQRSLNSVASGCGHSSPTLACHCCWAVSVWAYCLD